MAIGQIPDPRWTRYDEVSESRSGGPGLLRLSRDPIVGGELGKVEPDGGGIVGEGVAAAAVPEDEEHSPGWRDRVKRAREGWGLALPRADP